MSNVNNQLQTVRPYSSSLSGTQSFKFFLKNDLKYDLDYYWLDFDGKFVSYSVFLPETLKEMHSYFRHVFVLYNRYLYQTIVLEMGKDSFLTNGITANVSQIKTV